MKKIPYDTNQNDPQIRAYKEAADYAKSVATAGTAVFIHETDGRIKDRLDY